MSDGNHVGFIGIRYLATRLCEMFCLVDTMPDDPEYRREAAGGNVLYFQKIIEERSCDRDNAIALTEKAKVLEAQWKASPDYKRQMEERRRLSSAMSVSVNKSRKYTRPINCHPFEKPPVMKNFPKDYKLKNKKPAE